MYCSHPTTFSVLTLVFHMNSGLLAAALQPHILADTNRDGVVNELDADQKHVWTRDHGAIFLPNVGDTDMRCATVDLAGNPLSNFELAGCHDASGDSLLSPRHAASLQTTPLRNVSQDAVGHIYAEPQAARERVRIFARNEAFAESEPEGWKLVDKSLSFNATSLKKGIKLRMDAREFATDASIWDGLANIRFDVVDSGKTYSDHVAARVAPVIIHHHLQRTETVLSTAGHDSAPWQERFVQDLDKALDGIEDRPRLTLFNQSDDIWAQDFLEPAYASMPGVDGPVSLRVLLRSAQSTRMAGRQVFEQLRGPDMGGFQPGQGSGFGFEEINSGGNIETIPPYTSKSGIAYSSGRAIMGKHYEQMPAKSMIAFLEAQNLQNPLILETGWLAIGHVDEMVQFVPFENELGWTIAVADTQSALDLMMEARFAGHGSAKVISYDGDFTPDLETLFLDPGVFNMTIDDLLTDEELLEVNMYAQKHLDSNLELILQDVTLDRGDVLRIPTLFKDVTYPWPSTPDGLPSRLHQAPPGERLLKSFFPQSINGLVLGHDYLAPQPWGPIINGEDILGRAVVDVYGRANMSVTFIDDYMSHHVRGGEVHCGTNALREALPWWT